MKSARPIEDAVTAHRTMSPAPKVTRPPRINHLGAIRDARLAVVIERMKVAAENGRIARPLSIAEKPSADWAKTGTMNSSPVSAS